MNIIINFNLNIKLNSINKIFVKLILINSEIVFQKYGEGIKLIESNNSISKPKEGATIINTHNQSKSNNPININSNNSINQSNLLNNPNHSYNSTSFRSQNLNNTINQTNNESLKRKRPNENTSFDKGKKSRNIFKELDEVIEDDLLELFGNTSSTFLKDKSQSINNNKHKSIGIFDNSLQQKIQDRNVNLSTSISSDSTTLIIKEYMEKEKNLQEKLFNTISKTIEDLRKIAVSTPTLQSVYSSLHMEKSQLEMSIFQLEVEREKVSSLLNQLNSSSHTSNNNSLNLINNSPINLRSNSSSNIRDYTNNITSFDNHEIKDGYIDSYFERNNEGLFDTNGNKSNYNDNLNQDNNYSSMNYIQDSVFQDRDNENRISKFTPINFSNYQPKNSESNKSENRSTWASAIENQLKDKFAIYTGFRLLQREAIDCTMERKDVLVVMPTGGGKSLCYQLPASMSKGVTIVVSPLLSLIQDQVIELKQFGVNSTFVSGESQWEDHLSIYNDLQSESPSYKLIFVTPEKINRSNSFQSVLCKMNDLGVLDRFVIDEAHCISKWGQYFRQDYLQLSVLKRNFPDIPILALTATATNKVQNDIIDQLNIPNCKRLVSSFNRANLKYYVKKKTSNVIEDIADFIKKNDLQNKSGIIYCLSRKDCEKVAEELTNRYGLETKCYYADNIDKKKNHELWKKGHLKIICATIAFGMGINKPDVRFVIHHSMPKTVEDYYQESGRAGRDGEESHCLLFFSKKDRLRQIRLVASDGQNFDSNSFNFTKVDFPGLNSMTNYCTSNCVCRRTMLLHHFGETYNLVCNKCDICMQGITSTLKDVSDISKILVSIIKENGEQTPKNIISIAKGTEKKKTSQYLGKCKQETIEDLEYILRQLVIDGYLIQSGKSIRSTSVYETFKIGRYEKLLSGQAKVFISVKSGTNTKTILVDKNKRIISTSESLPMNKSEEEENQKLLRQELFVIRATLASESGVSAFNIAGSVTIDDMALKKPKTLEELNTIQLFPKERIRNYGLAFLKVIRKFCSEVYKDCTPVSKEEETKIKRQIEKMFPKEEFIKPPSQNVQKVITIDDDSMIDDDILNFLEEEDL